MRTSDFDYELPATSIAQEAIEPRDASRLLRVATMSDHRFADLPRLLEPGDLLVVNRTRVRRARLRGHRVGTGGAVELLLLRPLGDSWEALVKPARRIHPGVELQFDQVQAQVLTEPDDGRIEVFLSVRGEIEEVLASVGELPLPPYFRGELEDDERYQTVFATVIGSAAAPTAALHFTPQLVARISRAGVDVTAVELDVGLDTFRPMSADLLADHTIHREHYVVPREAATAIEGTRRRGGRVIAVGTTVMRTLESAAAGKGLVAEGAGVSSLFVTPGYSSRVVDGLITNFHAPRTTLIVLIAALVGESWREIYRTALERGYRFLSFGDAMFIENLRTL